MRKMLVLILSLCLASVTYAQQYTISAYISGFKDQTKFFLKDLDNNKIIDSALIRNSKFIMKGKLGAEPDFLRLYTIYDNYFYYAFLFIANDKVTLRADKSELPYDFKITGSKSQDLENILLSKLKEIARQHDQLSIRYQNIECDSSDISRKKIWDTLTMLSNEDDVIRRHFIKEHLNSFAGIAELNSLKAYYNKDTLLQMYDSMLPMYKQSKYGRRIDTYLRVGDITKVGDNYFDFSAIDENGKLRQLSDIKGKYILLDFSIYNCIPCMESIKDMKALAQQFPDKLTIVSFSADADKNTWLSSINNTGSTWLNLWDGKSDKSETILKYGVTGYPTFCLIDPKGKIVSIVDYYTDGSLEKMVKEIIGK